MTDTLDDAFDRLRTSAFKVADDLVALRKAVKPILADYGRQDNPGLSDLDNEQPMSIRLTLGDLRQLDRLMNHWRPT